MSNSARDRNGKPAKGWFARGADLQWIARWPCVSLGHAAKKPLSLLRERFGGQVTTLFLHLVTVCLWGWHPL
ncbi:MAG: hypothetical protein ACKO96_32025, partial [Flammeovirgaceae bacterium]